MADWRDTSVPWGDADLVVVRSTWDHTRAHEQFVRWTRAASATTRIANPAPVIGWNTCKSYLVDLNGAGLPVVPTTIFRPGDALSLPDSGEYVVKPLIGAGSIDTLRAQPGSESETAAKALAMRLLADDRGVVTQPYIASVDSAGETAIVMIAGAVSHVVRKGPILVRGAALVEGLFAPEDITGHIATPAEIALATAAERECARRGDLLYCRVDMVQADDGLPVILEVELAEPSLFLTHAPGSAERLAAAIALRAAAPGESSGARTQA